MRILKYLSLAVLLVGVVLPAAPNGALAEGPEETNFQQSGVDEDQDVPTTFTYTYGGVDSEAGAAADASWWNCDAISEHPHNSGHFPGNVNAVSSIECNVVMQQLTISTTLQKLTCVWFYCWWNQFAPTGTDTRHDSSWARSNSAADCQDGIYRAWSYQYLVWPNGDPESGWTLSETANITC